MSASLPPPLAPSPTRDPAAAPTLERLRPPADLADIAAKVVRQERLSSDDGLRLFAHPDLLAVGRLADAVRRRLHGDVVYYNINRHINPTNVCMQECSFCAFGRKAADPLAYEMSHQEVYERAASCAAQGATELHIVAGLHPLFDLAWYEECFRGLKARFPQLHLKCMTAVEIAYFAKMERLSHREVLERLVAAGLESMPGGGAEIFHPDVRRQICDNKCDADEWIEIHRTAHGMGLKSNCTMLYGHIEGPEHRVDHLLRLRALQDETGGFQAFIPLAFHPENTALSHLPGPTGMLDLRVMAVSRLMLDNVPHVKAYWIMLGPKTAQVALSFGADDLDGTVVEERIVHMAGATSPEELPVAELKRLITETGRVPVERDTLYRRVERTPAGAAGASA
jgi:aminodeoxyfutalosine synthase